MLLVNHLLLHSKYSLGLSSYILVLDTELLRRIVLDYFSVLST